MTSFTVSKVPTYRQFCWQLLNSPTRSARTARAFCTLTLEIFYLLPRGVNSHAFNVLSLSLKQSENSIEFLARSRVRNAGRNIVRIWMPCGISELRTTSTIEAPAILSTKPCACCSMCACAIHINMSERRSRPNTLEEKKKMRNSRKKRRRSRAKVLEAQLEHERALRSDASKKVTLYRNMSRSYWERWQWELQRRKESMNGPLIEAVKVETPGEFSVFMKLILNCYTAPLIVMRPNPTSAEVHLVLFGSRHIVA